MKIKFIAGIAICLLFAANAIAQTSLTAQTSKSKPVAKSVASMKHSIYDFTVEDIDGQKFDFSSLRGKKIMIVNTASKCGFTPQYAELEKLYKTYKEKNFVIVGFPANNFGAQEPGTNSEIHTFCQKNYGVTFPMMSKISVKGDDMAEIYKYLTQKSLNGSTDSEVAWNFQKYLIDETGHLVKFFPSKVTPMDPQITKWIESK